MAKDSRISNSNSEHASNIVEELINECKRQEESCLFTSTIFYLWLRNSRIIRICFIVVPIILASVGTWSFLNRFDNLWILTGTALSTLLAGVTPAIFNALNLDSHVELIAKQAAIFKCLQDRFRQCWKISSQEPLAEFKTKFEMLMNQMDAAREQSITPPERYFKKARMKIESGHYAFQADKHTDLNDPG